MEKTKPDGTTPLEPKEIIDTEEAEKLLKQKEEKFAEKVDETLKKKGEGE